MRYPTRLTVPVSVTRHGGRPLHEQIAAQLGSAVDDGLLVTEMRLPSSRTLAELLGVSRGVVDAAYDTLLARGYLDSRRGSGTYVTGRRRPHVSPRPGGGRSVVPVDLRPGQPTREALPLTAWRAAWRQAGFRRPPSRMPPPRGVPELRQALADHLTRTYGIPLAGREIVVTRGTAPGLRTVVDVLGLRGAQTAVEEPTPPLLHRVINGTPLPVDAQGARLDAVPATCRAVVISPDGQAPLGRPMSEARRRETAAWAATGGQVIEVAAGTALPGGAPLPRLSALAGADSIVVGGLCELFTPTLGLGFVIVPRDLAGPTGRHIADHDARPPYVTQAAVTALLRDGTVARLLRRLGDLHRRRRQLTAAALGAPSGASFVGGATTGTGVLYLPPGRDADRTAGELLTRGVRVDTLSAYHSSATSAPPALVLGYGHLPEAVLDRVVPVIGSAAGSSTSLNTGNLGV